MLSRVSLLVACLSLSSAAFALQCTTVDFSSFSSGDYVTSIGTNIAISAIRSNGYIAEGPRIYDTNGSGGRDRDLEVNVGNVLIIQESKNTGPDDNAGGGTIQFRFHSPVLVKSATVLDTEKGARVVGRARRKAVFRGRGPSLGNGEIGEMQIDAEGVDLLNIKFAESGALVDLVICEDTDTQPIVQLFQFPGAAGGVPQIPPTVVGQSTISRTLPLQGTFSVDKSLIPAGVYTVWYVANMPPSEPTPPLAEDEQFSPAFVNIASTFVLLEGNYKSGEMITGKLNKYKENDASIEGTPIPLDPETLELGTTRYSDLISLGMRVNIVLVYHGPAPKNNPSLVPPIWQRVFWEGDPEFCFADPAEPALTGFVLGPWCPNYHASVHPPFGDSEE